MTGATPQTPEERIAVALEKIARLKLQDERQVNALVDPIEENQIASHEKRQLKWAVIRSWAALALAAVSVIVALVFEYA